MKSMTGFGSATLERPPRVVSAVLKSVNHRYLDVAVRLPSSLAALEAAVKASVQRRVARGRIEVLLSVQGDLVPGVELELNEKALDGLRVAADRVRAAGIAAGELSVGEALRIPHVLRARDQPIHEGARDDELRATIEEVLDRALADLDSMRRREGALLEADLAARRGRMAHLADAIERASVAGADAERERLHMRLGELVREPGIDAATLAQEVVRWVARSDVSEELVRLRAHLAHWEVLVAAHEPCGRKLDFLLQEMNREINTIGSKAEGRDGAVLIVEAKAELEKMREQVQNVE